MMTIEDIKLLVEYFDSVEVKDELKDLVKKLNLMKTIHEAQDELVKLSKVGE